ncbi:hypothetical protein [Ktedonobacter racemifer]|uniref:hypothetical protein n=1 Tax=Ktedonobacter racemifer TaxID=363277 RepID=UPI001FCC422D|nr:hypothetical protein [Ktedonobacter racemifer]
MVFANPEEIHAGLVGKDPLFNDVADVLSVREWAVILVVCDIAEGVKAQDKWKLYGCSTGWCCCHVYALFLIWGLSESVLAYDASARTASSNSVRCNDAPKTGLPWLRTQNPSKLGCRIEQGTPGHQLPSRQTLQHYRTSSHFIVKHVADLLIGRRAPSSDPYYY